MRLRNKRETKVPVREEDNIRRDLFLLAMILLIPTISPGEVNWSDTDVGGGGWLQSGTFHPTNPSVILVGTDVTGGVSRSDDSGRSWYVWNEGLPNTSEMLSMYVEDLIGIEVPGEGVFFYAATQGGIYRASEAGPWEWMAEMQPSGPDMNPEDCMIYWENGYEHREPISYSCLDWNGEGLLVAGAGRVRWERSSYETDHYPGEFTSSDLTYFEDPDQPQFSSNPNISSVWAYDFNETVPRWKPLDIDMEFGSVRDISIVKIGAHNKIVIATTRGIWLHDYEDGTWEKLSDNDIYEWNEDPPSETYSRFNYGSDLTSWSIHITERGTVYTAVEWLGGDQASGAYRLFDAAIQPERPWMLCGNGEPVSPHAHSMKEIGSALGFFSSPHPQLIYLSVADGVDEAPDLLFLGCRRQPYGLSRGVQPNSLYEGETYSPHNASWTGLVTMTDWTTIHPAGFDLGWIEHWGIEVIFQPAIFPTTDPASSAKLAVQFNSRMHISEDSGATWSQSYAEGSDGSWSSRGYNEHGVQDIDFMSDGRVVMCNADTGTFISTDATAAAYDYVHPEFWWLATPLDNSVGGSGGGNIEVRPNWRGGNHDVLFANYTNIVKADARGKILAYREWMDPVDQWLCITGTIPNAGNYSFRQMAFAGDETIFVAYYEYDMSLYEAGNPNFVKHGVLKGRYDSNADEWDWYDWSYNLPDQNQRSAFVTDFLFNEYEGGQRIFLALAQNSSYGGGLWMLPDPDATTWDLVYYDESNYRDFRCLAQPRDGSLIYAGARGRSGGCGGILKCSDPSDALNPASWTILANNPYTQDYPFQYAAAPPFWQGDWPYLNSADAQEQHLVSVMSIAVEPENAHDIWAGLSVEKGMDSREGIWSYDSQSGQWLHRSQNEPFVGMGAKTLAFNPHANGQLFYGTSGQGLYFNGILATSVPEQIPEDSDNAEDELASPGNGLRFDNVTRGQTTFRFVATKPGKITIEIYDVRGRLVQRIARDNFEAGEQELIWDGQDEKGNDSVSGVYLVKFVRGGVVETNRLILVR